MKAVEVPRGGKVSDSRILICTEYAGELGGTFVTVEMYDDPVHHTFRRLRILGYGSKL